MNAKRKSAFFTGAAALLFIGLSAFVVSDDDPVLSNIIAKFNSWVDHYPTEKVYLQLDKPYYAVGEDIWFKAYVTEAATHQLSPLSSSVNIELINEKNEVKQWIKLPLKAGTTWGNIALSDTLQDGNYRLRAYTNLMRNAGADYYFDRPVTILSSIKNSAFGQPRNKAPKTPALSPTSGRADVQFFPESGSLVNGIRSKVAFKAVGPNGLGVPVKGVVTDNDNSKAADFSTAHLGMGMFYITPASGKSYKAKITFADGSESTVNLPAALNSGYVMNINDLDADNLNLRVTASKDLVNAGQVYILAHAGGETRYVAKSTVSSTVFNTTVPKSKFPSGIVQFTLFSATGEPLNERIVFIQQEDNLLKLGVTSAKTVSAPREKVKINLDAQTSGGKPVVGTFSASVVNESVVQSDETAESTILSHMLLTSDLKGYIEQPNYYFADNNEAARTDLDVLMLTQGYRRFTWKPLLAGTIPPPTFLAEKFITIAGSVNRLNGKPVENAKVKLYSNTPAGVFLLDTVADKQGLFAFSDLIFQDSLHFVIQAHKANNSRDVLIKMDHADSEDIPVKNKLRPFYYFNQDEPFYAPYLSANKNLYNEERKYGLGNHNILLKEVRINEKPIPLIKHSDNLNGVGKADVVVTAEQIDRLGCAEVIDCIVPYLPGVIVRGGLPYYMARNTGRSLKNSAMLIIVDGVHVTDLYSLTPHIIASVEFLKSAGYTAMYGLQGDNGVLVITTKRGNEDIDVNKVYAPGLVTYSPKGYYRTREFYSPQYDDPKTNKAVADLRTTIFWKPDVITDGAGHSSFEFFNAGSPGTYRVTIEGIDVNGNLGHQVYRYKVK